LNEGQCSSCVSCSAGQYRDGCPDNTATSEGSCLACPADSSSPAGSTTQTQCVCNAGYSGNSGGPCSACPAGKKKAAGDASCVDCGAGTFSPQAASTSCTSCPQFSTSPARSGASSACLCNQGYTGPSGLTCAACVAGKYKDVAGSAPCTSCGSSSTSPAASSDVSACACEAGFYSDTAGATTRFTLRYQRACAGCGARGDPQVRALKMLLLCTSAGGMGWGGVQWGEL